MNPMTMFTANEITGASLTIPMPFDENSTLESIVQSLRAGNFKTTKSYAADFTNIINDLFSQVTFAGKGFTFGLTRKKFSSQFLQMAEFVHSDIHTEMEVEKEAPSKLFAKENLDQISSDFNYILGLILGKLNLGSKNYEFRFNIHAAKEISTTHDLSYLLTPKSTTIFGEVTALRLKGINIVMDESMFGTKVQSEYYIHESNDEIYNKNSYNVKSEFRFRHSGPVDFSKLVSESISRLNNLTVNIMRDANESKS